MRKARFYNKALGKEFEVERVIGEFHGEESGPALVFFGGIHGNESSGVVALLDVMEEIITSQPKIKGSVYALTGNMAALACEQRYINEDLNRIWTKDRLDKLRELNGDTSKLHEDELEQLELYDWCQKIMRKHRHQIYFIDLHTTSAPTVPFITLNDTLVNRDFAVKFPVPVIIGIEEFISGPLLSWVMEIGYPSLAFEAGEHFSTESIENHKAFVWLSLVHGGLIENTEVPQFGKAHFQLAASNQDHARIFEVYHRKPVVPEEQFSMKPGYANLQAIAKGEKLAENVYGDILAPQNGRVFMPLYQAQGSDGFFLAREVNDFWLGLSATLRKIKFDHVLTILPGVNRDKNEPQTLIVNRRVARFLAVDLFHLLGYRTKTQMADVLRFTKREYDVKGVAELR